MEDHARFPMHRERTEGLDAIFDSMATQIKVGQGGTIAAQGQPADHVFRILRGHVRSCVYSETGDRSIPQFLGSGDYLGLVGARAWSSSQEAIETVVLASMSRTAFETALASDPVATAEVRVRLAEQVDAHARLLALMAHTSAVERVQAFLQRFAASRKSNGYVSLPMGRQDIADHLGLSMETVSRSISTLRASGEIELRGASFFRIPSPCDPHGHIAHAA
jgi:CRP/FNR family transcriptional regulator